MQKAATEIHRKPIKITFNVHLRHRLHLSHIQDVQTTACNLGFYGRLNVLINKGPQTLNKKTTVSEKRENHDCTVLVFFFGEGLKGWQS